MVESSASKSNPLHNEALGGLNDNVSAVEKIAMSSVDRRIQTRVQDILGGQVENEPKVWKILGRGKDKLVVKHDSKAYILPQASFLHMRRRNIEREVGFINRMKAKLERQGGPEKIQSSNLAIDITEGSGGKRFWITDIASGNLEKKILEKTNWDECKSYCLGFTNGMKTLHEVGAVHGDIKLENILTYPKKDNPSVKDVKVADFGKGAEVDGDNPYGFYSGNTPSGPPEGKLSKPGDVYGAAICVIRMLEEQFLTDEVTTLLPVDNKKDPCANNEERRGITKFILDNPNCTRSYEQRGSFKGKILDFGARVRTVLGLVTKTQLTAEQKEMNRYVDKLCDKLKTSKRLSPEFADKARILLKEMLEIEPRKRPNMTVAHARLSNILSYHPELPPRPSKK